MFSLLCFLAIVAGSILAADEIGSPLRVAQCRANCLQKFSNGVDKASECLQGPDCFMCWENCELLQQNFAVWGAMCSQKAICFPGCQQACRFHRDASQAHQSQPVIHTRGDEVVQVSGTVATWPRSVASDPRVYLVVARAPGSPTWTQLMQTVDLSARLPEPTISLRVLVVDPQGLVTIFSPVPTHSVVPPSPPAPRKKINTAILPAASASWHLRQVSLIHQKVLVIAEVTWQPRGGHVYLVTWEVDGGGLKGNLFTDATSVTLSLWPDTIYHIQVELESGVDKSERLVIDTHRGAQVAIEATFLAAAALDKGRRLPTKRPTPPVGRLPLEGATVVGQGRPSQRDRPTISSPLLSVLVKRSDVIAEEVPSRRRQMELLLGTGAAMLVLLCACVASVTVWGCRRRYANRPKKLVEEVTSTQT